MAINKIRIGRDGAVDNADSLLIKNAPEYIDHLALTGGAAKTYTVPAGAKVVLFSSTTPFYVKPNGTAAIPAADVLDGTGQDYSPTGYYLIGLDGTGTATAVTTLGFIASATGVVTILVHKI